MKNKAIQQADTNAVIAEITGALVGQLDMSKLLDKVVETTTSTLQAEACSIFLEDKQNEPGILKMRAGSGFARKLVNKATYNIGEAFTGTIAAHGQKFVINSREMLEALTIDGKKVWKGKFDQDQWPSEQSEFRNCIAIPLKIKDQTLGVMKVENKLLEHGGHFTEDDERYLEIIANVVALAIENARLHEQIEKQLKTIAAKAAHRINNQITNYDWIEMRLSMQVKSEVVDKHKLEEASKRMSETTRNLKRMVGEFKNFGKAIVLNKEYCDINKIIEDEIWLVFNMEDHAKLPANISIYHELETKVPIMLLDSGRVAEAIKELLQNSVKAITNSPSATVPGKITVKTKYIEEKSSTSYLGGNSKFILVEIYDNGPGFPVNFPIFEPFQSTDPQSTGLGLATVKELIEAHKGQIEAKNLETNGAYIKITIPILG